MAEEIDELALDLRLLAEAVRALQRRANEADGEIRSMARALLDWGAEVTALLDKYTKLARRVDALITVRRKGVKRV